MDYKQEARALIQNLDQRLSPSPYDIAWLARLKKSPNGEARWPDLSSWLLNNQHADGSWGGEVVYYHERIICTLAAMIALQQNSHDPRAQDAIKRAERYLWYHLHLLPRDPYELVGFELLFPTLLQEAYALGLNVPTHTCGYGKIQTAKLRLIPPDQLYSPHVSTVHSLEFLGQFGDTDLLQTALAANGSLGNSPATTAYYLLRSYDDARALAYLENVRNHSREIVYLYPFRTFELTWVLNNLAFCQLPVTDFAGTGIWQMLQAEMGATGIGLDPTFGIPDGDTTSVSSRLLLNAGYDFDPLILAKFEDKKTHIFRTYEYERNVSVGTNVHALEALRLTPDYPSRDQVREQIIVALLANRIFDIYWIDKWHASPYYATVHVLIGLLAEGEYLTHVYQQTVDWLVHTQRDDGSWGFFKRGTAEETAYVLTALLHFQQHHNLSDVNCLHRAADYLARAYQEANSTYPALWIGKCLFTPIDIVRAAILSALILYEETFGRSV